MSQWKWIPGYEGLYMASRDGQIFSCHGKGRILKHTINNTGRHHVGLQKNGTRKMSRVSNLVKSTFHGPRPSGQMCRHLNDNLFDNRLCNLSYGTHQDNMDDKARNGIQRRGEDIWIAKLKECDIPIIRNLREKGLSLRRIGELFGVTRQTIASTINGQTWTHVK